MARDTFDKELAALHLDMIKMGSMVEESIERTIHALTKHDIEMADRIIQDDDIIDDLEKKIERQCLNLIARQQPLAKDLRTIGAALKIITDMERIGDHSSDIAEITLEMAHEKYIKPLVDIPKMAECARRMVNRAIDAYVKQDIELAKVVIQSDDEVDELLEIIKLELVGIMKNNPQTIEQAIKLIAIAKYLERMGDHATNIAEWIIYSVTGEHEQLNKCFRKDGSNTEPTLE